MLKPAALKATVIRHFKNPMTGRSTPAGDLMSLCQSGFERDVLARLLALGYRAQLQVKVGPFSIDLVVKGRDDRRLAIELDGDQYHGPERCADDRARQRVMERVGWRFWRCWGSSYRLDPDGCLGDLVCSLQAMGIEPLGAVDTPTIWTEFRTLAPRDAEDSKGGVTVVPPGPAASQPLNSLEDIASGVEIGDRV